ncbi:hypothetical protein [Blastopirellula marina]|uniref:Uncharacterized protein n=1 Tax=Blastopirellula marina TaxID=124 RepID=A0A2S8GKX8_9BACT|nr:hypothetical protein [Blastopirellula marina]PQO45050.1 hypothetical protein C5Y93_16075 [Blastopirellula marina]
MSTLWNVNVLEVASDWVDLEVVMDHPDAGPFPEDRVFALCLLTGDAYRLESTDWIPNCPLGDAIPREQSYEPSDVAPRVDEFIRRALIYRAYRLPWDGNAASEETDGRVLADGIERDSEEWRDAWWEKWAQFWNDKYNLPRAIYRVWVTDAKWLQHLSAGMTFASAAYSETGPWLNENRMISPE